jgi:hypothetical protein
METFELEDVGAAGDIMLDECFRLLDEELDIARDLIDAFVRVEFESPVPETGVEAKPDDSVVSSQ